MEVIRVYPCIDKPEDDMKFVAGIYLHGKAQKSTDLIQVSKETYDLFSELPDGIYDVVIIDEDKCEADALMHFWSVPSVIRGKSRRGLICFKDDVESIEDAKKKFDERREWL